MLGVRGVLRISVSQPLYLQTAGPPLPPRGPPPKHQGLLIVSPRAEQCAGAANLASRSQEGDSASASASAAAVSSGTVRDATIGRVFCAVSFQEPVAPTG